jgi:hydrogenase maturation protease
VVCDAVRLGAAPGTIHRLDWQDMPSREGPAVSAHGIGLVEVLAIAELLYPERLPRRALLIGVEGSCFDQVGPPTPAVLAAVEPAAAAVLDAVAAAG